MSFFFKKCTCYLQSSVKPELFQLYYKKPYSHYRSSRVGSVCRAIYNSGGVTQQRGGGECESFFTQTVGGLPAASLPPDTHRAKAFGRWQKTLLRCSAVVAFLWFAPGLSVWCVHVGRATFVRCCSGGRPHPAPFTCCAAGWGLSPAASVSAASPAERSRGSCVERSDWQRNVQRFSQ